MASKACPDKRSDIGRQELDNEIKGEGNSINYKFRMHDPRAGRFFAVDPLSYKYSYNSPYAFSENNLIAFIELEGLEKIGYTKYKIQKGDNFIKLETQYDLPKGMLIELNPNIDPTNLQIGQTIEFATKWNDQIYIIGNDAPVEEGDFAPTELERDITQEFKQVQAEDFKEAWDKGHAGWDKNSTASFWMDFASTTISSTLLGANPGKFLYSFNKQSLTLGVTKVGISAGTQALTNNGNINILGAVSDGIFKYRALSTVGSLYEINFNILTREFSTNSVFTGSKSMENAGIEIGSSIIFGSKKNIFSKYSNSQTADMFLEFSNQMGNYSLQTKLKEQNNENENNSN